MQLILFSTVYYNVLEGLVIAVGIQTKEMSIPKPASAKSPENGIMQPICSCVLCSYYGSSSILLKMI